YFDRTQNDGLPIDPAAEQYRFTAEIYNHSVQNLLRLMVPSAEFAAGVSRRMPVTGRVIRFEVATPTKLIPADFCGHYEFVNEFRLINIRKRYARSGLGTPVIVDLTATHRHGRLTSYYTARMTAASTILLSFSDSSPGSRGDSAALRIYDTRETEDAFVGRNLLPLERDLTTPLARQLSNPDMGLLDTVGLLRPDLTESLEGLYMLEPFDPQRIPVLMVHGFWSNPLAWTQMFNDLIATPEIRQRYQFWFYLYPTGEPLPVVAARMRHTLQKMRDDCDPHRTMPALDQMVVAGHSMGGILGHMLTIDSGDELWGSVSSKPIDSLPLSATLRDQLEDTWFFKANPSVKRLITIATPYGGTTLSNRFTRSFLRTVTWLPTRTMQLTRIALRLNESSDGFVKSLAQTSIDSLARDSAVLALVQSRPVPDSVHHDN
ncbi:MAG: esterase/lipase family protein, partial [Planctomycetaceae bacterium]